MADEADAVDSPGGVPVTDSIVTSAPPPASDNDPHPETTEIIRQVEYYFSDENLPSDAYLLAKAGGDGNGPVPIKTILGFPKMRGYKPKSQVIASLKLSTKIQVIGNKHIQRREPLKIPLRATPSLGLDRILEDRAKTLREKPWLTKGMLKPTGFEEYATEGPIRPEEHAVERKLYDAEEAFYIRIENAVARYLAKRKMHSMNANILTQFLIFGGFDASQRQFSGGLNKQEMEKMTADEIALAKSNFAVAGMVLDGLPDGQEDHNDDDSQDKSKTTWTVDFLTVTKAFLSSPFMIKFPWYEKDTVQTTCNVIQNFHNYLLYHDVCPEYAEQILSARDFCKTAGEEFLRLATVDRALPGGFNIACSTLFDGRWAGVWRDPNRDFTSASGEDWAAAATTESEPFGMSDSDAFTIFATAVMAYGSSEQMALLEQRAASKTKFVKIHTADIGLEVVRVERLDAPENCDARSVYNDPRLEQNSVIKPLGRLHCKIWTPPHRPATTTTTTTTSSGTPPTRFSTTLTFLLEDSILEVCTPGLKMEATVCSLDLGLLWLDRVEFVYPSFFTWIDNETVREEAIYGRAGKWSEWLLEGGQRNKEKLGSSGDDGVLGRGDGESDGEVDASSVAGLRIGVDADGDVE